MRLNSLYKFFQKYFQYTSNSSKKQKQNYARAIVDTVRILKKTAILQNYKAIQEYYESPRNHPLVVKFLNNFEILINNRYENPFNNINFYDATITIDKTFLSGTKKDIDIPCPYLFDINEDEVIIITFGQNLNMIGEIGALKGLVNEFNIDIPWPNNIKYITYWDLSTGSETTENYADIKSEPRWKLLNVLNQFC